MRRWLLLCIAALAAGPARGESLEAERTRLAALTAQEDALEARIGVDRNTLSHLLAALALYNEDPPPPLIVRAEDAQQAVRGVILARALATQVRAHLLKLDDEAADLARLRRQTAVASGDLFVTESQIEDRQGRLDALARDAALLAPPTARAASIAEEGLAAPTSLTQPTPGKISVRFGGRLESGLVAQGVAFRPPPGAEVVSPAAAVVDYAGPVNGWGEVVILRAGGGCHMVLSGLGKVSVAAGEKVAAASPIGAMPTLGQPPPELYFELRLARGVVDPTRMMIGGQATVVKAASLKLDGQGVD